MNSFYAETFGQPFRPNHFVSGQTGASNNRTRDTTLRVQSSSTLCWMWQGRRQRTSVSKVFQLCHSLGRTGSGMRMPLMLKIREGHFDRIMETLSTILPHNVSDKVVVPYSVVISFHLLVENADVCMSPGTEALYDICCRTLKPTTPTFGGTVDEKYQWIYDTSSKTGAT